MAMGGTSQNEDTMKVWLCIFTLWYLRNSNKNSWWFDQPRHGQCFHRNKRRRIWPRCPPPSHALLFYVCVNVLFTHFWPLSVNVAVNCAFSIIIANYCNPYWCQWTRQFDAAWYWSRGQVCVLCQSLAIVLYTYTHFIPIPW